MDPWPHMSPVMTNFSPWLPELLEQVQAAYDEISGSRHDERPAWEAELAELKSMQSSWAKSLGRDIPDSMRETIEAEARKAERRQGELESLLRDADYFDRRVRTRIEPAEVIEALNRLDEVLANGNPTRGNLELSMHIDRITCFPDGTVTLRTCKLGSLPHVVESFSEEGRCNQVAANCERKKLGPRRRTRLRVLDDAVTDVDVRTLADFAGDPNRFADLGNEWFWLDVFHMPAPTQSWAVANSEKVFRRRQESGLSCGKLAVEFRKSRPTISAAIAAYLAAHPGEADTVTPRTGGSKPRIDYARLAIDAKELVSAGLSKVKAAAKLKVSTPTLDKALALIDLNTPTRAQIRQANQTEARRLFEQGLELQAIATEMKVTTASARDYLRGSFAQEGRPMPDLRRKEARRHRRPT